MTDISGVGNFGNDPILSALQQQGDNLIQQQQGALNAAARGGSLTQDLSADIQRGLGSGEEFERETLLSSQLADKSAVAGEPVGQLSHQNNEDRRDNSQRQESDVVKISREARERILQDGVTLPPGEKVGPEQDNPLLIDTSKEIEERELTVPLDRGNNETAAGRELGRVLDQFS